MYVITNETVFLTGKKSGYLTTTLLFKKAKQYKTVKAAKMMAGWSNKNPSFVNNQEGFKVYDVDYFNNLN